MLFQSRLRYTENGYYVLLDLLPALPKAWASGSMNGVCAKGNLELEFSWQDGKLLSLTIKNKNKSADTRIVIRVGSETQTLTLPPGETRVM
jgi:alpha-L-fucosidase 2